MGEGVSMKTICTQCGSDEIYIDQPEISKLPETQTLDEMVENIHKPVPLVYKITTWKCKKCGYSISR